MSEEDKELLLKDLLARLPYGVMVQDMEYNLPPANIGHLYMWTMEVIWKQYIKNRKTFFGKIWLIENFSVYLHRKRKR